MSTLLHVSASPRGAASESLRIAESFLDGYRSANPNVPVDHFDLWDGNLPEFGAAATGAKMSVFAGEEPTGEQKAAWDGAAATFDRFNSADRYLFSVPMWNHGIPYILKQFIDVVSQPGMLFSFDPETGYTGLLADKKAVVIYTGAVWGPEREPAFGTDFQAPYFESWLRWSGVQDIRAIRFQPNLATADADGARAEAHLRAEHLGRQF